MLVIEWSSVVLSFHCVDEYYQSHGLSVLGLAQAAVDTGKLTSVEKFAGGDYVAYVHGGIPIEKLLPVREGVIDLFRTCHATGIPIYAVTNGDAPHARRVLSHLGLLKYVKRVFDVLFMEWVAKPKFDAFARVLHAVGIRDPTRVIFFDDSLNNVRAAWRLGLQVVHVKEPIPAASDEFCSETHAVHTAPPGPAPEPYLASYTVPPLTATAVRPKHVFNAGWKDAKGTYKVQRDVDDEAAWVPDDLVEDLSEVSTRPWMKDLLGGVGAEGGRARAEDAQQDGPPE